MKYIKKYSTKENYNIFYQDEFETKLVLDGEQSPKVIEWLKSNEFEVVPFVPMALEDYKKERIGYVNQLSFDIRSIFLPDYKIMNAGIDVYEDEAPGTKIKYKQTVKAFRVEFYRLKGLIEVATTNDEIDGIIKTANYPTAIIG